MNRIDWATDFDVLDRRYLDDPVSIWDRLRTTCPVAHTDRRGSTWMPTRYDDIVAIAHDPRRFSSRRATVIPLPADPTGPAASGVLPVGLPPITADPPLHSWTRRLLLPWLSRRQVDRYEAEVRQLCRSLAVSLARRGHGDAAADYARQIPVLAVARLLGVSESSAEPFAGWVHDVLGCGDDIGRRRRGMEGLLRYFWGEIQRRQPSDPISPRPSGAATDPGRPRGSGLGPGAGPDGEADLLGFLLGARHDGAPVHVGTVLGMVALVVLAGVDTTWSALSAALWHLACRPDHARLLRRQPARIAPAVEELLRVYAPVTMARVVTADTTFSGCPMSAGDRVLLTFAAANHDPAAFPDPHQVLLHRFGPRRFGPDRSDSGAHLAFGTGIHRCAGSALARMELRVAIDTWLQVVGEFHLSDPAAVRWIGGQVRGPATVPIQVGPAPSRPATPGTTVSGRH